MQEQKKELVSRKKRSIVFTIIWLVGFSLVNYPIGAWAGQKIYPFVLGMPFSLFYFWSAYSLLIAIGIIMAWKLWRD
ncbi:MAG: hypothetical protein WAO47_10080 [Caldicoprobacterales bacterium]|jgi:hypothetical protein|nr:hypothetical protein [Clostridiales bacterium]